MIAMATRRSATGALRAAYRRSAEGRAGGSGTVTIAG
jgi:hypothetical protein